MFLFQVHDTHFFRLGTGWLVYLEVQNAHVPGSSFRQKKSMRHCSRNCKPTVCYEANKLLATHLVMGMLTNLH